MSTATISPDSCAQFIWNQRTKVRCHSCGVDRGNHVGGYISTRPSDPMLDAYLSQTCDHCSSTATHNGISSVDGRRGQFCNKHTDFDQYCRARND